MIPPEQQSPRTALALSDLQSTSSGQTYAIGGGGISGLAIASHGSANWSTRGVGGIGAASSSGFGGLAGLGNNGAGSSQGFGFGSNSSSSNGGIFNNCGCSSSDYGLFKKYFSNAKPQKIPQKQCQNLLIYLTLLILFQVISISAQHEFHYANEQIDGKIRQFVDPEPGEILPENNKIEILPDCSQIPNLLCCTSRVLKKCYDGCLKHVQSKCAHKLKQSSFAVPKNNSELPSGGGFIQPLIEYMPTRNGAIRVSDTTQEKHQQNLEIKDNKCGTVESSPAFLPCYSRRVADSLFGKCCRENIPSECRFLCTYEHREEMAAKLLISAVQTKQCDLKWLSAILYCANQNRDNRDCCRHLSLASPRLGVGDRCLRMCNVDEKAQNVGTIDQQDLVCLSNWNVIMYCARSGIRSLARLH